jgi:putative oxidoreductase
MSANHAWLEPLFRVLMSLLFLVSATTKVTETTMIQGYMHAYGVPTMLVWPAAVWEFVAGFTLLAGFGIRPISLLLAGWCILTAAIFHTAFSDLNQLMNFFKNLTMAGGFLMLARNGSPASIDSLLTSRRLARHRM